MVRTSTFWTLNIIAAMAVSFEAAAVEKACVDNLKAAYPAVLFSGKNGKVLGEEDVHDSADRYVHTLSQKIVTNTGKTVSLGASEGETQWLVEILPGMKDYHRRHIAFTSPELRICEKSESVLAAYTYWNNWAHAMVFNTDHIIVKFDIKTGKAHLLHEENLPDGVGFNTIAARDFDNIFLLNRVGRVKDHYDRGKAIPMNSLYAIVDNKAVLLKNFGEIEDRHGYYGSANVKEPTKLVIDKSQMFAGVVFQDGSMDVYALSESRKSASLEKTLSQLEIQSMIKKNTLSGFFGTPESKAIAELVNQLK